MNDNGNIRSHLDEDGVLLATIDMPGRSMNVFSGAMMDSLEALLDRVEATPQIRAVVITSGKEAFVAGADLDMIRMFAEAARDGGDAQLDALFGRLGRLFRRLERSPKPYVAAINGLALGGGLELCMACHARVAADAPAVKLGLPEVKLGLLPGAGGTQRLPRLIGAEQGLRMLLLGEPVDTATARATGLVDQTVAAAELIDAARRLARSISHPQAPWDRPGARFDSGRYDFSAADVAGHIFADLGIGEYQHRHYPAYAAIVDCVVGGWRLPMTQASDREMSIFVRLMRDPVAGNMVRALFLDRQRAAKQGLLAADGPFGPSGCGLLPGLRDAGERARAAGLDEEDRLLAIALRALAFRADGRIVDPALADAVIVNAGLFPAYAGGPFNHLRQLGGKAVRARALAGAHAHPPLFPEPAALDALLAGAEAAAAS
jgi:enoyl-CoA hydratase/carnithine racemase